MQPIFDDERRRNGGFQHGPSGVGSKSLLYPSGVRLAKRPPDVSSGKPDKRASPSKMLDGGQHRLALFSCSGTISSPTQLRVLILNRP